MSIIKVVRNGEFYCTLKIFKWRTFFQVFEINFFPPKTHYSPPTVIRCIIFQFYEILFQICVCAHLFFFLSSFIVKNYYDMWEWVKFCSFFFTLHYSVASKSKLLHSCGASVTTLTFNLFKTRSAAAYTQTHKHTITLPLKQWRNLGSHSKLLEQLFVLALLQAALLNNMLFI